MTYISVKEAAKLVGKNERTIRRWIKSGKMEHVLIRGKYHLTKEKLQINKETGGKETEKKIFKKISATKVSKNFNKILSEKNNDISYENVRKEILQNKEEKTWSNTKNTVTGVDTKKCPTMEEGVEYFLDKNMSENMKNNMSVKKIDKDNIGPQISTSHVVEMSDNANFNLSEFGLSSIEGYSRTTSNGLMSGFQTGLSTDSDMSVDKYFDTNDRIESIKNNIPGHYLKYSGHLDRTLGMSAFAVRLIEEKEKLSEKYREENSWLKNEIIALREELFRQRGEIVAENDNRAKLSDFLIENNKFWQEQSEKILKKNNIVGFDQKKEEGDLLVQIEKKQNKIGNDAINNMFWFGWLTMWAGIILLILVVFFYNLVFSIFL